MNRRISSSPSMNRRFEIRSAWSTKQESQPDRLTFLFLRLEGALPPDPLSALHSVRYPRGSRPADIALRAPSRSPPGGLRTAFDSLIN